MVRTDDGIVVCTHLWWMAEGPAEDPYAPDPKLVHEHRARVLDVAAGVDRPGARPGVPVTDDTPR